MSYFYENVMAILIGIALNLHCFEQYGHINNILIVHEYMFLFVSSSKCSSLFEVMILGLFTQFLSDHLLLLYKNATDFCILILYYATSWNLLMSSGSFLLSSLEFSCTVSCHLQTVTVLLIPFQFGFLLFLFIVWLKCMTYCMT